MARIDEIIATYLGAVEAEAPRTIMSYRESLAHLRPLGFRGGAKQYDALDLDAFVINVRRARGGSREWLRRLCFPRAAPYDRIDTGGCSIGETWKCGLG